jgi:hypothetical protein
MSISHDDDGQRHDPSAPEDNRMSGGGVIERIVGILGILLVAIFVGYMAYRIPAVPFVIIVALVIGMLVVDYVRDTWLR